MEDQATRLREHPEQLRPPAPIEELAEVRAVLGVEQLPRAVLLLYADHGGMDPAQTHLAMRLLGAAEAADAIRNWRVFGVPFEDRELGVLWSDDNGNGAGVGTSSACRSSRPTRSRWRRRSAVSPARSRRGRRGSERCGGRHKPLLASRALGCTLTEGCWYVATLHGRQGTSDATGRTRP
jgi:hypothetical protein